MNDNQSRRGTQNTRWTLEAGGPTWRLFALGVATVLTLTLAGSLAQAQDAKPETAARPLVIEMFTSQGCSSCPPADRLINEMARKPGVFALSLPVDYWDYIGWKDTLALPAHSNRQRQYARTRGDSSVYTPQAVIDGIAHVVGSDPGAIRRMAEECFGKDGALLVPISAKAHGAGLRVELGAAPGEGPRAATLWLVRVASKSKVAIKRGENSGKTVEYSNVSRGFVRIGEWSGQAATFEIPQAQVFGADSDGWMVLLQAGGSAKPGVILAAAKSDGL